MGKGGKETDYRPKAGVLLGEFRGKQTGPSLLFFRKKSKGGIKRRAPTGGQGSTMSC